MNRRKVATLVVVIILNTLICASTFENDTTNGYQVSRQFIENEDELSPINSRQQQAKDDDDPPPTETLERKWISQLFQEAEREFDMDTGVTEACKRDYEFYKMHLRNQSVWAVRMMESSEWPSVGIFSGTVDHFGNWDECLIVSSYNIKGQYCLTQATYSFENSTLYKSSSSKTDKVNEEASVWSAIEMYLENPVRVDRHKLSWALCIPSSCKNTDLKLSLNNTLFPIFKKHGLNITLNVEPTSCKINENEDDYPPGYYVVSTLYGVIFSLVVAASIYDVATRKKIKKGKRISTSMEIFKCFSAVTNFKKLIHYSPKTDYAFVHFGKIMNILFVIYGHRFIFFIGYPKFNSEGVEVYYTASSIELVHTNVVDAFFAISGFLTFHFGFLPMLKGGGLYLFFSIIFRWIRMVPVFGILMLFIIYILPYMNDGPMWNYRVMHEVENCKSSWWANLLVINNIVKTDQQCLVVSWYISADMQLAIIGALLLFVATRNKKLGLYSVVLAFLTFTTVTFVVAYVNKYYGLLRLYISLLEEPRRSDEFANFYVATYTRVGPYLLGFFGAFLARILKEKNYQFSGKKVALFSFLSILVGEGSQYYGCLFYVFGREYNRTESAIYASLNRSLFALPIAVILCMYFTSGLGSVQKIFERKIFVPLGRLTYCVFLVNTILQLIHASAQRNIMPTSARLNLFWLASADILISYMVGLMLHLFCEAPIINMSKILQRTLASLYLKKKTEESIDKTDSASTVDHEKSSGTNSKTSTPEMKNGKTHHQNGYHNQSFTNNEIVPNVSESSKF